MEEKVILAFDFDECDSRKEAIRRAKVIVLRPHDQKRIFVVKEEIGWPEEK